MPAQTEQQRKMIFARRNMYGSEASTPEKWKWIWHSGWENKGKLPLRAKKKE